MKKGRFPLDGYEKQAALALLPFAGLTPLWFIGSLAQAGVLETGQIEPSRWLVAAFAGVKILGGRTVETG